MRNGRGRDNLNTIRDELISQAIDWMSSQVEKYLNRPTAETNSSSAKESGSILKKSAEALLEQTKKCVTLTKDGVTTAVSCVPIIGHLVEESSPAVPRDNKPQRVDINLARQVAKKHFERSVGEIDERLDVDSTASNICLSWNEPHAVPFAKAWLSDHDIVEEEVMRFDMMTVAISIGVAATAAVLAIAWVVRRGRKVKVNLRPQKKEIGPSDDFKSLLRVAKGKGLGAEVAAKLVREAEDPWSWSLEKGIEKLTRDDKHEFLNASLALGVKSVEPICPQVGETFNARTMTPAIKLTDDDCWVVANELTGAHVGFSIDKQVVVKAQVEVCTADWWVLSRPDCPVGRSVVQAADELIAGGREEALWWRAPWGLKHPEDLRERLGFNEISLEVWRSRMIAELNKFYVGRDERNLNETGFAGEAFQVSTMEDPSYQPVGDTVVVEVIHRDGVPQYGLACPGGSPLLLAIVKTKPAYQGAK